MSVWINYHHLFYFKTIAEEGSISKAGEKLRLGQPTLSAQLKNFEDSLGVQLFERQHKKLILTEHGALVLEYAKTIFNLGGEMYEALNDRSEHPKLSVRIGALDSISKQIMLELTKSAYETLPCRVSLIEGSFDYLLGLMNEHKLDIILTNYLPRTTDSCKLFYRSIARHEVAIYGAKEFAALSQGFPQSIKDKPFVLPTFDSQLRSDFEHWLKRCDLQVDVIAETQDIALKKLMCIDALAMIPASYPTVRRQLAEGHLYPIGQVTGVYEELFLVSKERKISNPIAKELMKGFSLKA